MRTAAHGADRCVSERPENNRRRHEPKRGAPIGPVVVGRDRGAFITAALSLALLALGTGIGLSVASPWMSAGRAASRIGRTAIVWLVLIQIIAPAVGGYVAGRLRTRWVHVHTHEVFFRDTAHGFLVWAVALVMTAAFLTSASNALTATDPADLNAARVGAGANGYAVEQLLRTNGSPADRNLTSTRDEIALIFANGLRLDQLPAADRTYASQLVSAATGATASEAERRVDDAYTETRQAEENRRRAVAHAMYWTFCALLVGAFCASVAATIGGRERDRVVVV